MPKQTFFNLPEQKRDHIIAVAVEEFAGQGYDKASISRMVLAAGIAKGSFYQYFQDKADLYEYIVTTRIARRKLETFQREQGILEELTLTGFLRHVSHIQLREFRKNPQLLRLSLDLLRNSDGPVQQRIMSRYRGMANTYFVPFIRMEKEQGELDPRADEDVLNFMLVSLRQYLAYRLTSQEGYELTEEEIDRLIDKVEYILTNGIYMKYQKER